jgi:hypothetical protein
MVLKRASATSLKCTSALWPAYLVDKNTGRTWQAVGTCLRLCYIPVWKGGSQTVQDRHNIIMCNMHTLHTHTHPHPQTPTHTHTYIYIYKYIYICRHSYVHLIHACSYVQLDKWIYLVDHPLCERRILDSTPCFVAIINMFSGKKT